MSITLGVVMADVKILTASPLNGFDLNCKVELILIPQCCLLFCVSQQFNLFGQ